MMKRYRNFRLAGALLVAATVASIGALLFELWHVVVIMGILLVSSSVGLNVIALGQGRKQRALQDKAEQGLVRSVEALLVRVCDDHGRLEDQLADLGLRQERLGVELKEIHRDLNVATSDARDGQDFNNQVLRRLLSISRDLKQDYVQSADLLKDEIRSTRSVVKESSTGASWLDEQKALRERLEAAERRILAAQHSSQLSLQDQGETFQSHISSLKEGLASVASMRPLLSDLDEQMGDISRVAHSAKSELKTLSEAQSDRHRKTLAALEHSSASRQEMEKLFSSELAVSRDRTVRRLTAIVQKETEQFEALLHLQRQLGDDKMLPPTGGWALDARSMAHLLELVGESEPRLLVELGSGSSTVWLGRMCKSIGTRIVSVEHDPHHYERTRRLLERHDLSEIVDLRYAPITEQHLAGESYLWYDLSVLDDLSQIDFLLVDGPPKAVASRSPALNALEEMLSSSVVVVLDDIEREEERGVIEHWAVQAKLVRSDEGISRLGVLKGISSDE